MTDKRPWSDDQQRYVSNLSQIPLEKISILALRIRDARIIIDQLINEKTKRQTILELEQQIENETNKKTDRNQSPISNEDPCLTIDDDDSSLKE